MPKSTWKVSWKILLSEFLGTFLLVFLCVAVTLPWDMGGGTNVKISLANGLTVASLITIFGSTSGCHINPAVTLSMLYFKHIERKLAVAYIIFQCLGAITGAAVLRLVTPLEAVGEFGVVQPGKGVTVSGAFGTEFVITFILLFVIFSVSDEGRQSEITGSIPLAVGLTVTICSLIGNPFSGACMNPARSLGPAVVMSCYDQIWIYWAAPIAGGLAGASVYHWAFQVGKVAPLSSANAKMPSNHVVK